VPSNRTPRRARSLSRFIRLANANQIAWRNGANSANLALTVNASDQLAFSGTAIAGAWNAPAAQAPKLTVQSTAPSSPAAGDLWVW